MTDATTRDCRPTPVASGDEHRPDEGGATSNTHWLQQVPKRYHMTHTTNGPVLTQVQGAQLSNTVAAAPCLQHPRMTYARGGFPSALGHQGTARLDVFQPASSQQVPSSVFYIDPSGALPSSHIALDSVSPTQQGALPHFSRPSPCLPNRAKRQSPADDAGQPFRTFLDAQMRMHLSEMHKIQHLQYMLDHHITQQRSLPGLPTGAISSQARQLLDLKCSNNVLGTLHKLTPETRNRSLRTESNPDLTCVPPATLGIHQDHGTLLEIDSKEAIATSALDVCPKKESSSCAAELVNKTTLSRRHVAPEIEKSSIGSPVLQQGKQMVPWESTLPHKPVPFLPPDTSLRNSHSLNLLQQAIINAQPGLVTQSDRSVPPPVRQNAGKSSAIRRGAVPDRHVRTSFRVKGCSGEAEPESALSLVAEVGCTSQGRVDIVTKTPSGELHKPLLSRQSVQMGSCSDVTSLPPDLPPVPNAAIMADISAQNKPTSVETQSVASKEQSRVPESDTSVTECDFREKPPADSKCPICKDRVSGYHYGMYSCESCKGFFKRMIHSKRHKKLSCSFGGGCLVDLQSRKQCATCRFQKCLTLGMKLEAIRQDRQRGGRSLYEGSSEQRRLLKLKGEQAKLSPVPQKRKARRSSKPENVSSACTSSAASGELKSGKFSVLSVTSTPGLTGPTAKTKPKSSGLPRLIQELITQEDVFTRQSVDECCLSTLREEKNLLETICHFVNHQMLPLVKWAKGLPMYRQLPIEDQIKLLYKNILSILCLNAIFYCLDHAGRLLLPKNQVINLTTFNASKFHQLVPKITSIADQLHVWGLDLPGFVCLKLILLLSPDAMVVQSNEQIQSYQETAQGALFEHIARTKTGDCRAAGNLMLGLAAIERVAQQLNQETVWDLAVLERTFCREDDVCPDRPCIRYKVP